ncbi:MAG: hypothetical protein HKN76_19370, partial [Saprospiraceae bacterium]|nr:hypothetical protein [Saprospiraceae bacterium]
RLDHVFFPGGDPGHNHPRDVLPFLRELSISLKRYHPTAGIWISLQGFSQEQIDYFYTYLDQSEPTWIKGVVTGPSSPSISETRFRLPFRYMHRHYPDITHNVRCDYPVQNWDQAFALTLGREGINPQPEYYAKIHAKYAPFTDGFVSYSDGAHDDVNKIIWSQRGWYPQKEVREILVEYCRFFFNPEIGEKAADGILGLERNWAGPLAANGGVEMTFSFWQKLEEEYPELQSNWRWQLLVMRAYYDTYIRRRLINEQVLEQRANAVLMYASEKGSRHVVDETLHIFRETERRPVATELKTKINTYADLLFASIGLQTRLQAHHASGAERGCILDFLDYPLNNRRWYEDQFSSLDSMATEKEKIDHLSIMTTWENPGHGSYYDDISNIAKSPHVFSTVSDATDFAWWDNGNSRARLSWQVFQRAPELIYTDLDPDGRYLLRICGYGEALARVDGLRLEPILYDKDMGQFKEFIVPRSLVGDSKIHVTFDQPEESQINWRNHSRISDVWLLKR